MLRRFSGTAPTETPSPTRRTAGELLSAAKARRDDRERLAEQRRSQERAGRERRAAAARERRLDALAAEEEHAWAKVSALIDTKRPQEYDSAIALLTDLREVADRMGQPDEFDERYRQLRHEHRRKPSLIQRLDRAGLDI
ncbi:MAG TPA: hypothetical protein VGX25_25000 [Actinophytocola sp.]|uniref:hypothetical protein n=1 Tax=Actinophytocola sp. TaxID=1872138 RepID=UPI002DDD1186|nr:hypothetical protein [Actinophytocola sp.]HEV2782663.1 hypothetical protein [Actinophytocola sp.]